MSRWQEIVTAELRRAGSSRAEKREAFRKAKEIYHGHAHRMNPSLGGGKLVKVGLVGALVYGGVKLYEAHQAANKPPPNPYAQPLYPTGAVPSNKPT